MRKKIVIVDYGSGNILSAKQSFLKTSNDNNLNADIFISNNPKDIETSSHIVLPGQGAFKSCMEGLKNIPGMIESLKENIVTNKKPFLGICVGMQLLANTSYENGEHKGLGWIEGEIKKLKVGRLKLPHMGWNNVKIKKNPITKNFFSDTGEFYFVHSYYFDCYDGSNIIGSTHYGIDFPSIVVKENIYGVQFHPEKSSHQGLQLIKNFLLL
jgi:glutamine amidotransferase